MKRPILLALAVLSLGTSQAFAQEPKPATPRWSWTRPVVRYGKWLTAATAAGLTVLGAREHRQSADAWNTLLEICRVDNADCQLGSDGRYINPLSEANYQRALYYDSRARKRLVAGQVALVISAAMFIADLRGSRNGPPNIPFDPNRLIVEPAAGGGTRMGLRFSLP